MKNVAIGVLVVVLATVLLQPIGEFMNLTREKISIGTALTNAARSAKDRSLEYDFQINLDAQVNEERFYRFFGESFEDALDLTWTNKGMDSRLLKFTSDDGRYGEFTVELEVEEKVDDSTEQIISIVHMTAETNYKFKTKYLQLAEAASNDVPTKLISKRELILSIKN